MDLSRSMILQKGIGQLGFVVEDLYSTMEAYCNRFGIDDWRIYTYKRPFLSFQNYRGREISYSALIGLSYFGPTRIELIQNLEGETIYTDFIRKHGYGLQHLGIYVEDMQEALRDIRAAGFDIEMEGGGFGLDGDGHFAYLDTEPVCGITYELIERPKRRPEPEAVFPGRKQH